MFEPLGINTEDAAASFYPAPAVYRRLLEAAGFTVDSIELIPRPTPLPRGMKAWLETFRNGVLDRLEPQDREEALSSTVQLLEPILRDGDGNWVADYVRLRSPRESKGMWISPREKSAPTQLARPIKHYSNIEL